MESPSLRLWLARADVPFPSEHASQLMQRAFDVAIATVSTASYISDDAMAQLNVQNGA